MGISSTQRHRLTVCLEVIQPFFGIERMVVSTKVLKLHTIQLSKTFKVSFVDQGLTNSKRNLAVDVNIPGVVIVVQGSAMIPLLLRLFTKGMWKATRDLRDPLVCGHV